jgi:hypothetical protein
MRAKGYRRPGIALGVLAVALGGGLPAMAQSVAWPPTQVTPYVAEPGVPQVTITAGSTNPLDGAGSQTGNGTTTSSGGTSSDALNTLLGQSWGAQAISEAEALGVNPSALAATCVLESGCTNAGTNGTAEGAFQMQPAAFQDGLATALAADPALASQIVQGSAGMSDPATEAIAASGYLMQATQALEADNISNPTVLDTRSYYEFGPTYGADVATAQPSALMSSVVPSVYLTNNDISSSETVAQYQASVASEVGNAANQSVMS